MNVFFEKIKRFFRHIAKRILVHNCSACGVEVENRGELCPSCYEKYLEERRHGCKYCHMNAPTCVCSTRHLKYSRQFNRSMYSLMFYDLDLHVFKNTIFKLKTASDRSPEVFFANEMSRAIILLAEENGVDLSSWYITYPPRSRKRKTKHGFDHSENLAKRIAVITGMTYETVFRRRLLHGARIQKYLSGQGRRLNAEKSFSLKAKAAPKGKSYIIIDDIIASGSTARQCQKLLLKNGAKAAFPISIAKTYYKGEGFDGPPKRQRKPDTAWFMD